jgi:hypothetical protein
MKKFYPKIVLVAFIFFSGHSDLRAQNDRIQQGVLFKKGTNIRISHANILNKRTRLKVYSNDFGIFRIMASVNDTLEISGAGYISQNILVGDYKDVIIFLQPTNQLEEVQIRGKTIKQELEEVGNTFRSKGVFYKGKPRIYLAVLKPLTFLYETFGKTSKNARKFDGYAQREIAYHEIAGKFNRYTIKKTVAIKEEELTDFIDQYWPTIEQIRRWNDYDLISYIRRSYLEFKAKKPTEKISN